MNKHNAVNGCHQPHDLKLLYYVLTVVFLIGEIYLSPGASSLSLWNGDGKALCDLITHTQKRHCMHVQN